MNENDGYMTLKRDYMVFYAGKMSELFFNLLTAFIWTKGENRSEQMSCFLKLTYAKGQMFNFYTM